MYNSDIDKQTTFTGSFIFHINLSMPTTTKTNLQIYFFFLAVTFAFYGITYKAGFVTDFMGWVHDYDNYSFTGIINSEPHKIKSFYHFTHLLMYAMTYLFRISGLPWFLVFSGLYALDAFLLFTVFNRLFTAAHLKNGFRIAMMGVLFFMLSPYQAEVMVWRASFHYLTGFAMMLGIVHLALIYYDTRQPKYYYYAIGIFTVSVFSLEYFIFTPVVVALFIGFKYGCDLQEKNKQHSDAVSIRPSLSVFKLPVMLLGIVTIYFLVHYAITKHWLGHRRDGTAGFELVSMHSFSTYGKYIFKELFFLRYLEPAAKDTVFNFFDKPVVSGLICGLLIGITVCGICFFRKMLTRLKFIFLNFCLFSVLLVPVISIFFYYLQYSENDRYGFFPSAFIFMALSLALSYLPKKLFYVVSCAYLIFSGILLIKTNRMWMKSERVFSAISNNFHWWDNKEVCILNAAGDYKGVHMFRYWDDVSGIIEAAEVFQKKKFTGHATEVVQYNMTTPTDGVNVKQIAPDTLLVTFNQWGNWWWKKGLGASNYETTDYKVILDFNNCGRCYALVLKNKNPARVYLYQDGDDLKEFKLK